MILTILMLFLIASVYDLKYLRVPIHIPFICFGIRTLYYLTKSYPIYYLFETLFVTILVFILLYLCMRKGSLGGADVLLGTVIAYTFGTSGLYVIMLAFLLTIPYLLFQKEKKEYPFVPFLTVAFLIKLII